MQFQLEDATALLARTPASLDSLLRGLPDSWTLSNEGQIEGNETWTVRDVVAHLIHADRNDWLVRVHQILKFGETRSFVPFVRDANREEPVDLLLDEFAAMRVSSLDSLHALNLSAADLNRRGLHSTFGIVTLSQLLATWTAHDLTHLHQISRILAHQYREAVGPWSRFLGVMQCSGHSAAA